MTDVNITGLMYDWANTWPVKEYKYISPSSLGGCMRAHYFKLMGVAATTPPGPGALLNFELGRMWESPVEKALQAAGVPFISQLRLEDKELGVGGTLDVALFDHDDGSWELVSIKTEGKDKSRYRARQKQTFFQANPEYGVQEACYRHLMEVNGFKVKNKARYLVITKDNGFLDEPELEFSPELIEVTMNRIKRLRKYLDDKELPPCECEGWKIGYCNFGNPETQQNNTTGKLVNTSCCDVNLIGKE